jgi:hypothetical protein
MCEQQYFIEYVLGHRSPSNKKADKGTIVHKVLEILAMMKHAEQNKQNIIQDDIVGDIDIEQNSMFDSSFIHYLIETVYEYYTSRFTHHEWDEKDKKDCTKWVNQAVTYNGRMFDPRLRNIVQPEQKFDIIIDKPWAKYEFDTNDGKIEGNLGIKGTIDLITQIQDDTLEIIDWKTGRRLDWATGEEKTLAKLEKDPQLRMYHYAVSILYPHIQHIIVSINFINDGGAFSVCFDKSDIPETEKMLREKFEVIKSTQKPRLNKTWKCNKLCHFGKTSFDNEPLIEYRNGMKTTIGEPMCKCEQIKHDTDLHGIDFVVDNYTFLGHNVTKYKDPGSVE